MNMPSETLEFYLSLPCNVWMRIVVKEEDFALFPTKNCFNAIQLPALDIAGDNGVCRWQFPVDDSFAIPPGTEHHLFCNFRSWLGDFCVAMTEPLTLSRVVNLGYPLLVASDQVLEPREIPK
ncbi:unnamed protein product [Heligmosomoides polygyrus]|uniref:Conserved hypothethical protein n=1 Tax=Heligmosomoides polygyrus TaxID=6339 RepID=A0A183FYE1_HELPZ|nr:unnamed protein product [Heligmosomoides polygyrus]